MGEGGTWSSSPKSLGTTCVDREKANKVAQQERRASALTAELAAQSETKTAVVRDQPPGLGELVVI